MPTETERKKNKRCTITRLAKLAEVSVWTVSNALSGNAAVAEETRRKILSLAEQEGYVPDARFRAMGQTRQHTPRRTGYLGVMMPQMNSPRTAALGYTYYYQRMFWGIEAAAREAGASVIVSTGEDRTGRFLPAFVQDRAVDGVLVCVGCERERVEHLRLAVPTVLVNTTMSDIQVPALMSDNGAEVRKALAYLTGLGHRRIRYFGVDDSGTWFNRITDPEFRAATMMGRGTHCHQLARAAEYVQQALAGPERMAQASIEILPPRTKSLDETCVETLLRWKDQDDLPTAILCANDIFAVSLIKAAQTLGLSVPSDISLIGIDDADVCLMVRPCLTSVRQPLETMGCEAVRILNQSLSGDEAPNVLRTQVFDVELVVRDSCAAPRG